jgi:hypothetical protein
MWIMALRLSDGVLSRQMQVKVPQHGRVGARVLAGERRVRALSRL